MKVSDLQIPQVSSPLDAWFKQYVQFFGRFDMQDGFIVLQSPSGKRFKLKVADDGTLSTEAVS